MYTRDEDASDDDDEKNDDVEKEGEMLENEAEAVGGDEEEERASLMKAIVMKKKRREGMATGPRSVQPQENFVEEILAAAWRRERVLMMDATTARTSIECREEIHRGEGRLRGERDRPIYHGTTTNNRVLSQGC